NNPAKRVGLEGYGLRVIDRVPLPISPNPENLRYLRTKRDRMGHELHQLEQYEALSEGGAVVDANSADEDGAWDAVSPRNGRAGAGVPQSTEERA
ncbi:MAG TPA: hypothetical protein VGP03_02660, partial [Pseudonocardiaceae bacterium]|nr:hypothetical protein [Pseudonocardiaceae bacterium]